MLRLWSHHNNGGFTLDTFISIIIITMNACGLTDRAHGYNAALPAGATDGDAHLVMASQAVQLPALLARVRFQLRPAHSTHEHSHQRGTRRTMC